MCPLPWLEEAEDVQYNFDDVFITLRTIDIPIQQKDGDQPKLFDKRHKKRKTDDLSGPSDSIDDDEQSGHMSGLSDSIDDDEQIDNWSDSSGEIELYHQTRYNYDNVMLLYNT